MFAFKVLTMAYSLLPGEQARVSLVTPSSQVAGGFMRRFVLFFSAGLALALLHSPAVLADGVQVGDIEFNTLIPASGTTPGVTVFTINNFTGTNNLGFFPVADNLVFNSVSVTLFCANAACTSDLGASSEVLSLSDLGPGSDSTLEFDTNDQFSEALFMAGMSETTINLTGGSTFTGSPTISFALLPSSGSFLVADVDSGALIDPAATVPEPSTLVLLAGGVLALLGPCRRRVRR